MTSGTSTTSRPEFFVTPGYGDTLLDYNFRRTVFSIGFSLVEW